jgi:hypothetical protein
LAKPEDRQKNLYAKTFGELRGLSDDELRRQHDEMIEGGFYTADPVYYLSELARRESDRQTTAMVTQTSTMVRLTWFIGAMTVANVVLVAISLVTS